MTRIQYVVDKAYDGEEGAEREGFRYFRSLQKAINAATEEERRWTMAIEPGLYEEQIYHCGEPMRVVGRRRWWRTPIGWVAFGTVFPFLWWKKLT